MSDRPEDLDKPAFLARIGYGGDPALADAVLVEAGLTNPRKPRISASKLRQADDLLRARFAYVCQRGDCQARARTSVRDRRIVRAAAPEFCEMCAGSANRAAVDRLVEAFAAAGLRCLCVVGGSPTVREELARLVAGRIQLRTVDGTVNRNRAAAGADLAWADRVVIWASTELDHKVSALYSGANVLTAAQRGIGPMCDAVASSVRRRV